MSFSVDLIGGFNSFEWEDLKCPVCGDNRYTSLSHAAVYCECGAKFVVRMTAGDPGCVIDCIVKGQSIYAPQYQCQDPACNAKVSNFQKPLCPVNSNHKMKRVEMVSGYWKPPEGFPEVFTLILKHGDYCSGWMYNCSRDRKPFPTQKQWNAYQETIVPADGPGKTIHARYALISNGR